MLLKLFRNISIITSVSLTLMACGGSEGSNSSTGRLSIDITDAAVDGAEKVYVQFRGVTVKPKEGEAKIISLAGDSQTCKDLVDGIAPTATPEGEQTIRCIELKELQGTKSSGLIDGITLAVGNYNWIRLDVDAEEGVMDSIIVLDNGGRESLYIPSGSNTGLKINSKFTILAGGEHNFVIDFDLRKSVNHPQGNNKDYRLKPSLRLIDLSESGNIVGTIDGSLLTAEGCTGDINSGDGFAVYVYQGADTTVGEEGSSNAPYTSASIHLNNDGEWEYTVGFVAPGEYILAFTCQAADDSAENATDGISFVGSANSPVTVEADQDSTVNFMP
mgnify:CR=1 FL=1